MNKRRISIALLALSMFLLAAGCKKKAAPPPPPPPPPPAQTEAPPPPKAPTVQFTAEPSTIERGQSSTLRWTVSDATDVTISPAIGTVAARGTRSVSPTDSTTYTLTAKGPGGTESSSASVTVTVPPPPPPPPPPAKKSLVEMLSSDVQDAYFDYDKSEIREDARTALSRDADSLKKIFDELPDAVVVIEGHCDERGSAEYNLGLGDRRASSAKEYLVSLGVPADKLKTISYGKERPQCTEHNEECWQKNRRVHFSPAQ
jgi:peptidoglycan-associated lipoprotein